MSEHTNNASHFMNFGDRENEWNWSGMPEFVQEKQEPHSKIIFRFENEEDLQSFAKLIGQKLTSKTKSAWYPFRPHSSGIKEEWIVE